MLRAVLTVFTLAALLWLPQASAAASISSARVWPAQDYTRLTLESRQAIRHNMFSVKNPDRLVIDLEDIELGGTLNGLTKLIGDNDPYIRSMRVGQFKPGVVRLVLDLKSEVQPQLFELKPVGEYGYRLVLDVYPAHPSDPLMALLEQPKDAAPEAPPVAAKQVTQEKTFEEKPKLDQNLSIASSEPPAPPRARGAR